jgi:xanthine dehydrogenase accessory factor
MKDLLIAIRDALEKGDPVVLVTITESSGSVPREAGARMLIGRGGRLFGTTGGGIAEHLAEEEARALIGKKSSGFRDFILHPNDINELGVKCGGEVTVHFKYLDPEDDSLLPVIRSGIDCFAASGPAWLVMALEEGPTSGQSGGLGILGDHGVIAWTGGSEVIEAGAGGDEGHGAGTFPPETFRRSKCVLEYRGAEKWFSEPLVSRGFVYVFGGGHVAQEVVPLLTHLGFRCIIFDNRDEFVRKELFPHAVACILGDYDRIAQSVAITENDYVVIMTHMYDFQSTVYALGTKARYIGVIGSKTKLDFAEGKLRAMGFTDADIKAERVHAPIGIPIRSKTPAEIAVSVAGELILVRAQLDKRE